MCCASWSSFLVCAHQQDCKPRTAKRQARERSHRPQVLHPFRKKTQTLIVFFKSILMSQCQEIKRARTEQTSNNEEHTTPVWTLPGREQLQLGPEFHSVGQKYCDQADLLPLLLAHGLVRFRELAEVPLEVNSSPGQLLLENEELQSRLDRKYCLSPELLPLLLSHSFVKHVRTIQIEVHPVSGNNVTIKLDAANPHLGSAKTEIARKTGTPNDQQELYKAVITDGDAVREDDAEPELLQGEDTTLVDGEVLVLVVRKPDVQWDAGDSCVMVDGNVATRTDDEEYSIASAQTYDSVKLTEGKHYWEVELLKVSKEQWHQDGPAVSAIHIGVCNVDWDLTEGNSVQGWFIETHEGGLGEGTHFPGNGHTKSGEYEQGDRVGMLLDFDDGSLLFFKNGVQHGPGFPAGSVYQHATLVHSVELLVAGDSVRLLSNADWPAAFV
jgi:hypothetical protein